MLILLLSGCASKEERCRKKVDRGVFSSMEQCYNPPANMRSNWGQAFTQMGSQHERSAGEFMVESERQQNEPNPLTNCAVPAVPYPGCHSVCINGAWSQVCP